MLLGRAMTSTRRPSSTSCRDSPRRLLLRAERSLAARAGGAGVSGAAAERPRRSTVPGTPPRRAPACFCGSSSPADLAGRRGRRRALADGRDSPRARTIAQATPHEPRRVVREDGGCSTRRASAAEWTDVYEFTRRGDAVRRSIVESPTGSPAPTPESKSRNRLIAARAAGGRAAGITLLNRELKLRDRHGVAETQVIDSTEALRQALAQHFGLHFPEGTKFGEGPAPGRRDRQSLSTPAARGGGGDGVHQRRRQAVVGLEAELLEAPARVAPSFSGRAPAWIIDDTKAANPGGAHPLSFERLRVDEHQPLKACFARSTGPCMCTPHPVQAWRRISAFWGLTTLQLVGVLGHLNVRLGARRRPSRTRPPLGFQHCVQTADVVVGAPWVVIRTSTGLSAGRDSAGASRPRSPCPAFKPPSTAGMNVRCQACRHAGIGRARGGNGGRSSFALPREMRSFSAAWNEFDRNHIG